ncbi:MAG: dihydroneopterin aldolase [Pseudomonadota bacterium]
MDQPQAARAADTIFVRDYVCEAEIGVFQTERGVKQRLRFSVDIALAPGVAAIDDAVDTILSYDVITDAIAAELRRARVDLLETLAERIAARVLVSPKAKAATVRIEKLDRIAGALGVEIRREPGDFDAPVDGRPGVDLVFLAPDALLTPALVAALQREAGPGGLAFLLAPMALSHGVAGTEGQRIGELGYDAAAWAGAARLPAGAVVASVVALGWALKAGKTALIAPARLVAGAYDPPAAADPVTMLLWLQGALGAATLTALGGPAAPWAAAGLPHRSEV